MTEKTRIIDPTRRTVLKTACVSTIGFATTTLSSLAIAVAADDEMELVRRLTGNTPTESDRVRLEMPPVFANGYTVPLALEVDSPMTDADHVRVVRVFAPRNPLVEVAGFHFTPQSGRARISTRIRLAQPQDIVAVAEMSDGTFLMAKKWVEVTTNGCA